MIKPTCDHFLGLTRPVPPAITSPPGPCCNSLPAGLPASTLCLFSLFPRVSFTAVHWIVSLPCSNPLMFSHRIRMKSKVLPRLKARRDLTLPAWHTYFPVSCSTVLAFPMLLKQAQIVAASGPLHCFLLCLGISFFVYPPWPTHSLYSDMGLREAFPCPDILPHLACLSPSSPFLSYWSCYP